MINQMQLTELRVLNYELPTAPEQVPGIFGNHLPPDPHLRSYEHFGNELVNPLSAALHHNAVLAQTEGSIRQEWCWKCDEGSFLTF
jgi:hypothetical protein